jgi:hypothetical protein
MKSSKNVMMVLIFLALLVMLALLGIIAFGQQRPEPAVVELSGSRRRTETNVWWDDTILTSGTMSKTWDVSGFETAQVWVSPTVLGAQGVTLTICMNPDEDLGFQDVHWREIYTFGLYTGSIGLTYTTLSDVGKFLNLRIQTSDTTPVTPLVWLVLKE